MPSAIDRKASDLYKRLEVSPIKKLYSYMKPDCISFAGGIPREDVFPIQELKVRINQEESFSLINGQDLLINYTRGDGITGMGAWIQEHVNSLHKFDVNAYDTCVTTCSTDSYAKVIELLSGDSILYDKYAYGTAVAASKSLGRKSIGVEVDEKGMLPRSLREQTLAARAQGLNPDIVYLNPIAQNPTGSTMPLERKLEIYSVCQELDLIIVEDGL